MMYCPRLKAIDCLGTCEGLNEEEDDMDGEDSILKGIGWCQSDDRIVRSEEIEGTAIKIKNINYFRSKVKKVTLDGYVEEVKFRGFNSMSMIDVSEAKSLQKLEIFGLNLEYIKVNQVNLKNLCQVTYSSHNRDQIQNLQSLLSLPQIRRLTFEAIFI